MGFQVKISAGFILLVALLVFFDTFGLVAAGIPAIIVHEMGHIIAMRFFGVTPLRLTANTSGLSLDYVGSLDSTSEFFVALSGPALGLLFAFICSKAGRVLNSDYLLLCSGLGTVINLFNLLPSLPLDGGRALRSLISRSKYKENIIEVFGYITSVTLLIVGFWFIACGKGFALFIAGLWLLILSRKNTCKQGEKSVK